MTHREIVSYHEAGHAILALALGAKIASVTCERGRDYWGTVKFDPKHRTTHAVMRHRDAIISRGGALAEMLVRPFERKTLVSLARGSGDDFRGTLHECPKHCQHALIAMRILVNNIESLHKLARELDRRGTLTAHDLAALRLKVVR